MTLKNVSFVLRCIIAIIFLQTLYFKFTAQPESVYIFNKLGLEPFGRIDTAFIELIASLFILFPKTKLIGILISLITILGALLSHLLILGIEINNDGGLLFYLALTIFIFVVILIINYYDEYYDCFKQNM